MVAAALIAGVLAWSAPLVRAAGDDPMRELRVTGQCRSGQPQGNYALREPGGRLRVQGAFSHGQRTGSFIFWSADGTRVAHLPFDADLLNGTLSLWHAGAAPDGEAVHRLEAGYRAGQRNGATRAWHPNGRLREAAEYVDGKLASVRAWDETGIPLPEPQARASADAARAAEDHDIDALLAIVRRHLPDCAPPPARQQARAPRGQGAADAAVGAAPGERRGAPA